MLKYLRAVSAAMLIVAGACASNLAAAAASRANPFSGLEPVHVSGTIVDVAVGNPDFSTLVSALSAANLVTTLEGKGPFTVFAPTNAAFAKIPAPILGYLLANPAVLSQVLLYHVHAGFRDLDGAFLPEPVSTVEGESVFARITFADGKAVLNVNNSVVTLNPIVASNGIIYVVDSVLLPQFR